MFRYVDTGLGLGQHKHYSSATEPPSNRHGIRKKYSASNCKILSFHPSEIPNVCHFPPTPFSYVTDDIHMELNKYEIAAVIPDIFSGEQFASFHPHIACWLTWSISVTVSANLRTSGPSPWMEIPSYIYF